MSNQNKISLDQVMVKGGVVQYDYSYEGEVSEVFQENQRFMVDYFEDVEMVPESILVIPFLANILPISWVYDATITVPNIDKDFYKNIIKAKQGYIDMYPQVRFGGQLTANHVTKDKTVKKNKSAALLFSGGVDATSSLISMLNSGVHPRLITIWGADVELQDVSGWREKSNHTKYVGSVFGLEVSFIKSTLRNFSEESLLNDRVYKNSGDLWWHGFQHGIGMLGLTAPLIHKHNLSELHIAASFVAGDNAPCASDPTIDEHIHIGSCTVTHNGYNLNRQEKVHNIHQFAQKNTSIKSLPIKVCWESKGAKNCGHCEKCMRTACEVIAEGGNLSFYSLESFDADYMKQHLIEDNIFFSAKHWKGIHWKGIQDRLRVANNNSRDVESIKWLLDINFDKVDKTFKKRLRLYGLNLRESISAVLPNHIKSIIRKVAV